MPFLPIAITMFADVAQRPSFRILLVGMGPYSSRGSAFRDLNGEGDTANLATRLKSAYGLTDQNIHFVLGKEATKAKIEGEFRDWLVKDAKPTDTLVYFVSGHGTLVPARDIATGVRGATVPIDFRIQSDGAIDASSVITSDFYNGQITQLSKAGVKNVTLIFDTCYSGSAARGHGEVVSKFIENPGIHRMTTQVDSSKEDEYTFGDSVVIAAARTDRSAWENQPGGGNLTVALCRALRKQQELAAAGAGPLTYKQLYASIRAEMATLPQSVAQEPLLSPPNSQREVFSQAIQQIEPSYTIIPDGRGWKIDAGAAMGVGANLVVGIYPIGTKVFSGVKPIATARVVQPVKPLESSIVIQGVVDAEKLKGAPAQIIDGLADAFLGVDLSRLGNDQAAFEAQLASLPLVHRDNQAPDVVVVPPNAKALGKFDYPSSPTHWQLFRAGSATPFATVDASEGSRTERLLDRLRDAARYRSVQRLETPSPWIKVTMEFVPVKTVSDTDGNERTTELLSNQLVDAISAKGRFAIRVKALTSDGKPIAIREIAAQKAPYIAILDLLPRCEVNALWPNERFPISPDSSRLPPDGIWRYLGRTGLVANDQVGEIIPWFLSPEDGPGVETMKAVFTQSFVPLDALTRKRGDGKGANRGGNRLAELLDSFSQGMPISRGGIKMSKDTDFGVVSISIKIPEKK